METIEDIVREMRKQGKHNKENVDLDWLAEEVGDLQLRIADRIEAAVKALEADRDNWRRLALDEDARANATHKDSLAVGDMAAMREALETISDKYRRWLCAKDLRNADDVLSECGKLSEDALSKPPRNCDRFYSFEEAQKRFLRETGSLIVAEEILDWLFAEAKGENDGN